MTEASTKHTRGTPLWVKLLLGFSLALNLLIIGAVGGTMYRVAKSAPSGGPGAGIAFVGALEKEDRKAVLGSLRAENRVARRDGAASMREILNLLRADDFDAAAFSTLIEGQSQRSAAMQDKVRGQLVQQITAMDADARKAYADRLEARLTRKGGRKGQKHRQD